MYKLRNIIEGILNGPAPEDPDTSGLKYNKVPIVPKQTAMSPYDIVDEVVNGAKPEDAISMLINGNISDFKQWAKYTTKSQLLDAIVIYMEQTGESAPNAIKYIKRFVV